VILFVGRLLKDGWRCGAPTGRGRSLWPADELGCGRPWRLRGQGRPEAVAEAIASATLEAGGTAA
jgi:hypothetical protein